MYVTSVSTSTCVDFMFLLSLFCYLAFFVVLLLCHSQHSFVAFIYFFVVYFALTMSLLVIFCVIVGAFTQTLVIYVFKIILTIKNFVYL